MTIKALLRKQIVFLFEIRYSSMFIVLKTFSSPLYIYIYIYVYKKIDFNTLYGKKIKRKKKKLRSNFRFHGKRLILFNLFS